MEQVPWGTFTIGHPKDSTGCQCPYHMHPMPKVPSVSNVDICAVRCLPLHQRTALHHCSYQTIVTFNTAKVFQFLDHDAVHKPVLSSVQVLHFSQNAGIRIDDVSLWRTAHQVCKETHQSFNGLPAIHWWIVYETDWSTFGCVQSAVMIIHTGLKI